jgi:hypothetical protein
VFFQTPAENGASSRLEALVLRMRLERSFQAFFLTFVLKNRTAIDHNPHYQGMTPNLLLYIYFPVFTSKKIQKPNALD